MKHYKPFKAHLVEPDLTPTINKLNEFYKTNFNGWTPTFIRTIQLYRGQLLERIFAVRKKYKKILHQEVIRYFEDGRFYYKNLRLTIGGYKATWPDTKSYYYRYLEYEPNEVFEYSDKPINIGAWNQFTFDDVLKLRPKYKYCAWKGYGSFVKFAIEYNKCPYIEMLNKLDLSYYIGYKTIEKKLNEDKGFRRFLFKNAEEIKKRKKIGPREILKMYNKNMTADEVLREASFKNNYDDLVNLKKHNPFIDIKKLSNYLYDKNISLYTYKDFITAVKFLHLDTSQEKNVYPHDFMKWHDLYTAQYKAVKDKAIDENIEKVAEKYKPILKNMDNLVMMFPTKTNDFINEGENLHHCVGRMGYNKKMAKGESLIIFVRKQEEVNTPFLTLEYDPKEKKVLQFYGDHDSTPDEVYKNLIYNKWLPKVKRLAI